MAKIEKRKSVRAASVFYVDQIEDLDIIAARTNVSRADLVRQGAEHIITLPVNQAIIKGFKNGKRRTQ